jgi:peptidyl-prolyl cis-trans isomerase D
MLQDIRKSTQGPAVKIIIGLIVISFAAFGIESILLGGGGNSVAEVNGEEVSAFELQQAVNTAKRRLISMMGDNLDPAMLDDERLTPQALDGLISRKLELQAAQDLGLAISEQQIGAVVGGMEEFQIDGKFSPELYTSLLSESGYTPAYFKQSLTGDLVIGQLRSGLAGSDFATPSELGATARIVAEQRDIRYLTIPVDRFRQETEVGDEEVAAYYEANRDNFMTAETVSLDYIELRPEDFYQPVDESALREAYELEKNSYAYATENRVSHILFEEREGESAEEQQARVEAARDALDAGTEFAEVAGQYSDDVGSASAGGDLGFSSGDAFPEAMEEAIAALEVGAVSEPVETEAGIHLILVTERREGEAPDFDQLRSQLESRLQEDEAIVELLRVVESLRDLSFNSEDLSAPAEELDLTVERSEPVTRNEPEGLFSSPALLEAAFSEEVLDNGHNSEVIELAGQHFVVLRVHTHNLPEVRPLDEVRDDIAARISEEMSRDAVRVEAERLLAELRDGASVESLANERGLEWQVELGADRGNPNVPPQVLARAFQLPRPGEAGSQVDYALLPGGDAVVIELSRVSAGGIDSMNAADRERLAQQLRSEYGGLLDAEYRNGLRASAEINVM